MGRQPYGMRSFQWLSGVCLCLCVCLHGAVCDCNVRGVRWEGVRGDEGSVGANDRHDEQNGRISMTMPSWGKRYDGKAKWRCESVRKCMWGVVAEHTEQQNAVICVWIDKNSILCFASPKSCSSTRRRSKKKNNRVTRKKTSVHPKTPS